MFAPGSIPWLMRHELRLHWRGLANKSSVLVPLGLGLLLYHFMAIPVALGIKTLSDEQVAGLATTVGVGCFVLWLLMVSRALTASTRALVSRGDMELLLSSPLRAESIVAVRAAAITAGVTSEYLMMIVPFANVFVAFGFFAWVRVYVLVPAFGMLAASISLIAILQLVRHFGAVRARAIAEVTASVLFVLALAPMIVPLVAAVARGVGRSRADATVLPIANSPTLLNELSRVLLNGWQPTLIVAAASVSLFGIVVWRFGDRFVATMVAAARQASARRVRGARKPVFTRSPRTALLVKELRLLRRDPSVSNQLLLQLMIIVPVGLAFGAIANMSGTSLPLLWELTILASSTFVGVLALLTVSSEEAPDLLKCAPVSSGTIRRSKIQAALLPVLPLIVLPVAVLWRTHLWFALCVALCATGASASCAWIQLADNRFYERSELRQAGPALSTRGYAEVAAILAWYGVCALLV